MQSRWWWRGSPALLVLVLALGACATRGPQTLPRDAGVTVPPGWSVPSHAATTDDLTSWWRRFGDPQLDTLVAQALAANTSVAGAAAALRQARALRDVAGAGLLPQVGSSASVQRSKTGTQSPVTTYSAGLDASWELDLFGANREGVRAAEASAQASSASLGDTQVSVTAEVALAYISLRNAQARLAITRENLAAQDEALQLTLWRVQAGLATSLDSEQARSSVEQTRAQMPALQTAIAQNRHALAVLTGQAPAALDAELAAPAPVPQPAAETALTIPAVTLRQRADVRAAELQATAALAQAAQAEAQRLPSFQIGGSLGLNALTLAGLSGGGALAASVLASVSWPLFDGGAAAAQARAQQAAYEQAQASWQQAVLTALKDVEDALVALQGDRERRARLADAAAAAANAATLARQRYAAGLVDFQTVLDTQRTLLGVQDSLASAAADVSSDHVRLFKALGGGWTPSADLAQGEPPMSRSSGGWMPSADLAQGEPPMSRSSGGWTPAAADLAEARS